MGEHPDDPLDTFASHTGQTLAELSTGRRVLVVFLRHSGCTFCREALADLAAARSRIEESGASIALVHISTEADMLPFVTKYGVADLPRFSDPERKLYAAFELQRGSFTQLMGFKVWWRGFWSALVQGHGFGGFREDVAQMPGAFLIENGEIIRAYRHASAADRPDYVELACPLPASPGAD